MAFRFQKRKKIGKNTTLNIGKKGPSISQKAGPFSISTKGNASVRLGRGVSKRKKLF